MKKLSILSTIIVFCLGITVSALGQTEIIGSGNTAATTTLITTNSNPDTSMVILDDGNVGIGTTTPGTKLEVYGVIYSSSAAGGFQFPDGTIQGSAAAGVAYHHEFTVAKTGGDFTTISAALNACTSPSSNNTYLIRVMPGLYQEMVTCKKHVHIKGAGKYTTYTGSFLGADSCVIKDFNIMGTIFCLGTSPTIIHNLIWDINDLGNGIEVSLQGKPWIIENEIVDHGEWGIYCHDFGSDPWIIGNKILRNQYGGIKCEETSPTISNNQIINNNNFGIYLIGLASTPSEPTIDDNIISHSIDVMGTGLTAGIYMEDFTEPRIIANDIYLNEYGIWVEPETQPSIIGNSINYNLDAGIVCNSSGYTKPVVIKSNHIHSNVLSGSSLQAGIWVGNDATPIISHNNVHNNGTGVPGGGFDIDYSGCTTFFPMISLNVFDFINASGGGATGLYNVTSGGLAIAP